MLLCASVGCGYYIRSTPTIELAKYEKKKVMYLIFEQRRQKKSFFTSVYNETNRTSEDSVMECISSLVHIKRGAELETTPTWAFMSECQVYSFACLNFLRRIFIEISDDLFFHVCRPADVDINSDTL